MSGDDRLTYKDPMAAVRVGIGIGTGVVKQLVNPTKVSASTKADSDTGDDPKVTDLASELVSVVLKFTTQLASQVAHDLVTAVGDVSAVVTKHPTVGAVLEPLRTATTTMMAPQPSILTLPDASPGQPTSVALVVRNDSLDTFDAVALRCSALVAPGDCSIPGALVSFGPASVDVRPHSTATVVCKVMVPADATRGHYLGVIDAIGIGGVQLLIALDVV